MSYGFKGKSILEISSGQYKDAKRWEVDLEVVLSIRFGCLYALAFGRILSENQGHRPLEGLEKRDSYHNPSSLLDFAETNLLHRSHMYYFELDKSNFSYISILHLMVSLESHVC